MKQSPENKYFSFDFLLQKWSQNCLIQLNELNKDNINR